MQPRLGDFIEVYWPLDKVYYRGKVTAVRDGHTKLLYDDGDIEELKLGTEKWRFSANKADGPDDKGADDFGASKQVNDKAVHSDDSKAEDDEEYVPSGEEEDHSLSSNKARIQPDGKGTHAGRISKTSEQRITRRAQKNQSDKKQSATRKQPDLKKQLDVKKLTNVEKSTKLEGTDGKEVTKAKMQSDFNKETKVKKQQGISPEADCEKQSSINEESNKKGDAVMNEKLDPPKIIEEVLENGNTPDASGMVLEEENAEHDVRKLAGFLSRGAALKTESYVAIRAALKPFEAAIREAAMPQ